MAEYEDGRKFDAGDVVKTEAGELEVTGVSYQEADGKKVNFSYTFRSKAELDAERKAAKEAEEAAAKAEAEASEDKSTEE